VATALGEGLGLASSILTSQPVSILTSVVTLVFVNSAGIDHAQWTMAEDRSLLRARWVQAEAPIDPRCLDRLFVIAVERRGIARHVWTTNSCLRWEHRPEVQCTQGQ